MVLSMYGAREVDETTAPDLVHLVRDAVAECRICRCREVYIADNPQPNAFATGRNPEHAAVCVTTRHSATAEPGRTGRRAGA